MATYTQEQLELYFQHIGYPREKHARHPLQFLTDLQRHHLARVPFDNVALHYSPTRLLSLGPEELFQKIVVDGRGGYCMEVNGLFGTVLRSLGFAVVSVGGRVYHERWSHSVNLVSIDDTKYLIDVGFGSREPTQPVPLEHGYEFTILAPAQGRLELKHLAKSTSACRADPAQRLWVYSMRASDRAGWEEMYSFTEMEFFPEDFEMMSYFVSTRPQSWFTQFVVAYRMLWDEEGAELVGEVTLNGNVVKRRVRGSEEIVVRLESEEQRVIALDEYFDIRLTEREKGAIRGLVSEIK